MNFPAKPIPDSDRAWVDALRRYGDHNGFVAIYRHADGTVDAKTTVDRLMEMLEVRPKIQAP